MAKACASISTGLCGCGQFGIKANAGQFDYLVALAGNPNTGKSTVFNALTGLRQHTGNWPGKTVTRAEGHFTFDDHRLKLIDLPGTYSLLSASVDEEVARDFILFGNPDVTVVVVDATALQRNLNLTLQIMEITDRVVVCLNLMDEAQRKGIGVDTRALSADLGVPVVATTATHGTGLNALRTVILDMAQQNIQTTPHRVAYSDTLEKVLGTLVPLVRQHLPTLPNARWIAMRLLEGDDRVEEALRTGEFESLAHPPTDEMEPVAAGAVQPA